MSANTHMNPYCAWSNTQVRHAVPVATSVHGALPFAADTCTSNMVSFQFTAFNPTILNCTVLASNMTAHYRITTDFSMAGYTTLKNQDGRNIALIEWRRDKPLVEIRNMVVKQFVAHWLKLADDSIHHTMKVKGQKYIWVTPQPNTTRLYPAGNHTTPDLLAQITCAEDGVVSLDLAPSVITSGLQDTCIVATFLLQCGFTSIEGILIEGRAAPEM
ncbi:hypothetical protein FB45DRAFT_1024595 [Roridomyces roridus]|uniref:DUF6593 domain-containing protein n=1 Tax=Roridomyces roridus TaxID=1738132 RepID=A0AAD7C1A4_9AGAR|nr:hypothetical protein FB45DRAFT_1024595 [Roridomyces roridus]